MDNTVRLSVNRQMGAIVGPFRLRDPMIPILGAMVGQGR